MATETNSPEPYLDNGTNTNNELYLSAPIYDEALNFAVKAMARAVNNIPGAEAPTPGELKRYLLSEGARVYNASRGVPLDTPNRAASSGLMVAEGVRTAKQAEVSHVENLKKKGKL